MHIERHPLQPFLPENARILMLGSFPPKRERWCMDFFYPNWINDMWRIMGAVFYGDKNHFVLPATKSFDKVGIENFLQEKGIALYDTATAVRRMWDNASDKYLEVEEVTDIATLLRRLPLCGAVVTTGQKATEIFCTTMSVAEPPIGGCSPFDFEGRTIRFYRMPSSSRAYPLALERKADIYARMFASEAI